MSEEKTEAAAVADKAAALAAYNQVVEKAELTDIRLVDLKLSVKPKYYTVVQDEESGGKRVQRGFEHTLKEVFFDGETGSLGGRFDWSISVTAARKKLFSIDASFLIAYHDVPDVGREHVEAYLRRVGRFATYPYFRSLVSTLSWESKAELPIMPVLR